MRTTLQFSALVTALVALTMGATSGCGDDDSSGNALVAQVRQCGLLTEGEFHVFDEVSTMEDRCLYNCYMAASCGDYTAMFCGSGSIDPATTACFDGCGEGDFVCADGVETIPAYWVCDGDDDCADASDELGCATFDCADGSDTIPQAYVCNYYEECSDGSDEIGCSGFDCADGSDTINPEFVCDAYDDCNDGSDEAGCADYICP